MAPTVRRMSDRARDALAVAGSGSSVLAAPFARMAEVAGGVLVATVVTMTPALTTTAQPAVTAVSSTSAVDAPARVENLASTSVLYRASPGSPLTAGPAAGLSQPGDAGVATPSLVGPSPTQDAGPQDLLSQLGLAPGGGVVASTLSDVDVVGNILADQLGQVARFTNATLAQVTSPLGPQAQGLTDQVSEMANGLTQGLGNTLKSLGSLGKFSSLGTSGTSGRGSRFVAPATVSPDFPATSTVAAASEPAASEPAAQP
jgi:prophage DNA circulation protein